jgi:hypothetical protein
LAAARFVTVKGQRFPLPVGLSTKKAKEELMMMLPAIGKTEASWVKVTRIESLNWKHEAVYSQFADLRVRSAFADNGDLVWTENFGLEFNPVIDKVKTFFAKKNYLVNELKKVKKGSPKFKVLQNRLKPVNKLFQKFQKALKLLKV